jgi:hypothetical protein
MTKYDIALVVNEVVRYLLELVEKDASGNPDLDAQNDFLTALPNTIQNEAQALGEAIAALY